MIINLNVTNKKQCLPSSIVAPAKIGILCKYCLGDNALSNFLSK
jgi:hypothetical protein